jgi:hypothetical protein
MGERVARKNGRAFGLPPLRSPFSHRLRACRDALNPPRVVRLWKFDGLRINRGVSPRKSAKRVFGF